EVVAVHPLARDEARTHAVGGRDVAMREARGGPALFTQTLEARVVEQALAHDPEKNGLLRLLVLSAQHGAEGILAQHAFDQEAATDQRPGRKRATYGRHRRVFAHGARG